jgi:hypothetical protein
VPFVFVLFVYLKELKQKTMIKFYSNEKWKEVKMHKSALKRYAVSNYGRFLSFEKKIAEGRLLSGGTIDGYKSFSFRIKTKKGISSKTLFLHRLVAEYFLKRKSEKHTYVLHLDHDPGNNFLENLKWATKEEMIEHNKKSPAVIKARKRTIQHNINSDGRKLTVKKALEIKKRIFNPNRKTTLKNIAKQYGISEMHVYRIKSGENWGHLKIK